MSNEDVKRKIREVVTQYVRLFPAEFQDFKRGLSVSRDQLKTKWGEMKGTDIELRKRGEIPETLFIAINKALSDDERNWFNSKAAHRWFFKEFSDFAVSL